MAGHLRSLLSRGWPLALALYLLAAGYAIHAHGPLPLYSTRSLSVAWEMWLRGEFIVPQLNGAAYAHKVPLLYWLVHAGWAVGGVSDTWPRVLMLLIGSANLLLLAWFTRRLQPGAPRAAALAPWLLLGCAFWFVYSLQVLFDGLLACWVLLALGALLRGGPATPRPQWGLYSLAVAAGLLTKGPVMLLHVVPALLLAPWWSASVRAAPGRRCAVVARPARLRAETRHHDRLHRRLPGAAPRPAGPPAATARRDHPRRSRHRHPRPRRPHRPRGVARAGRRLAAGPLRNPRPAARSGRPPAGC